MEATNEAGEKKVKLRVIGRGTSGTVFEIHGTDTAVKKTLHTTDSDALSHEFYQGCATSYAFAAVAEPVLKASCAFPDLMTPKVPRYASKHTVEGDGSDDPWWQRNKDCFSGATASEDDKEGSCFYFERVPPLPDTIRENLIKIFFEPTTVQRALEDPENRDCFIRPYLGARRQDLDDHELHLQGTTLRNFPIYVDQMAELGMDPVELAREMALGLAAGHWAARIDMVGVKFAIASCAATKPDGPELMAHGPGDPSRDPGRLLGRRGKKTRDRMEKQGQQDSTRRVLPSTPNVREVMDGWRGCKTRPRSIRLWLFDFDKAHRFRLPPDSWKAAVSTLVSKTRANDPYYPSAVPATKWQYTIWKAFSETYIAASLMILHHSMDQVVFDLPDGLFDIVRRVPARVMKEWFRQEAAGMDRERLQAVKERARAEKWEES